MKLTLILLLVTAGTFTVHGVPINDVSNRSTKLVRGLEQDLNDFLDLVPTKEVEEILMEYLSNDEDFQKTMQYILSDDFRFLVSKVEAMEDVKIFIKYLADSGLEVYTILNKVHDLLGLDHFVPPVRTFGLTRITGGLPGLMDDIRAVLPVKKIEALYKEKLESSEEFAALVQHLGSPEFQNIVNTVWANEKLQELIAKAEAKGVDVKKILKLITDVIGIKFPAPQFRSITRGLAEDLEEFQALIPVQKIQDIVMEYLANDKDFQEAVEYMLSDDFKSLVLEVEAMADVKVFIKYLADSGLDVYTILNKVHDLLELDHYVPSLRSYEWTRITGGLPGLIDDIRAVLPVAKIEALYKEKLESSEEFAAVVQRLGSPEFQNIVNTVWTNEKLQELIARAEAKGVDVKEILKLITDIIGIKFPAPQLRSITRGLAEDLEEFQALVPIEKVQDIVMEYLANDKDFQEEVEYMLSDEFKSLVLELEAIEDVKVFIKYLADSGLDVYTILNKVHDFLGLDHYVPALKRFGWTRITGGLPGLMDDVRAILPVAKIEALYKEKLESSEEFAALVQRLGSPEFQNIVNTVWANEKLQELIARAEAKGVDVKEILKLITDIIGIKFPAPQLRSITRGLAEDLEEFQALVPIEKVQDIVMEYLANDKDFQEEVEYMLSDEFKSLVLEVEAIEDVKVFIKYLADSGLDVYTILNKVHDFLGLDHYVPALKRFGWTRIPGGLPGLMDDVRAILPVAKIEALYKEKLESSEEFAALVQRLGSPEFQNIVNTVWANEKLQELIARAEAKGVDVKEILKLITDIIGIKFPAPQLRSITRGLAEDLEEFQALVPIEKVQDIIMEYLANDKDFQEEVEYMLSDEFKSLVLEVEAIEDVKVFIKYLADSGLDVYTILNKVHDFLGLDHYVPSQKRFGWTRITGGLPGLMDDVRAILPVAKIEALYKEKLESSEEFAALVQRLGSPEFQNIVNTVWANEKLQELIARAEAKGVDVKEILKLVTDIIGIKFPAPVFRSITRGLAEDLEEFQTLVPIEKVQDIVMEYLANDKDFQEAVEYMLSDDFKSLVLEVEAIEDVKVFIKYLADSGLEVYTILNKVHDFLGLDHYVPSLKRFGWTRITGGLPGLIDDIRAVLPVERIEALYKEKLETSEQFAALVQRLGSSEFQNIVNTVWANEKLQELIARAEAKGVDVKAILKLVTDIIGIKFPAPQFRSVTRGLAEDLEEFQALIPIDKVQDIIMEYLAKDEDFQEAVKYMLSDDFKSLVSEVEAMLDVNVFIKYLVDSGLEEYTILNKVHDFLGLDHYVPPVRTFGLTRITGGLPGLIDDIIAVLPVAKIEALYKEKLESSEEFAALVHGFGSPEFQSIVNTIWANEKLQDLIARVEAKGVDVKAILKFVTDITGIKFPAPQFRTITRGLAEDLEEFQALVPMEKVHDIVMEYLANDKDFQEAVEYMLSDEFKSLVLEVEAIEDVKVFIKYLADSGLEVYTILNKVHDFLGLDYYVPSLRKFGLTRITGGLPGLIDDVRAILPVEKIEALYKEKLETSEEFAALVQRLGSPEFQNIVNTVWANEKLQELIARAESKGVDVKAILKLVTDVLGIKFPSSKTFNKTNLVSLTKIFELPYLISHSQFSFRPLNKSHA